MVVEGGQAVHEHRLRPGGGHEGRVHLIGQHDLDALRPRLGRLAHAHPHIGVHGIGPGHGGGILGEQHAAATLFGKRFALCRQRRIGPVGLGRAGHKMQPHLGAADHQRVAHVVPGVPHVDEFQPRQMPEMLL